MSVLCQRGWSGSSCPGCTRVAAVTVLRGLISIFGQWNPDIHEKIVHSLVQLEIWNADGWDRFYDPEDAVVSRQISSVQYRVRDHFSFSKSALPSRKLYLLPLCAAEDVAKSMCRMGQVLSSEQVRAPDFTMAVYPGLTFRGLSSHSAQLKLDELTRVQSADEREDCLRRLGLLYQNKLLYITGMSVEQMEEWAQHEDSNNSTKGNGQRRIESEWPDGRDVCTVCRRKTEIESSAIEHAVSQKKGYMGFVFKDGCKYCQAKGITGPSFHHGRCCPYNQQSYCRPRGCGDKHAWEEMPISLRDEEARREEYHAIVQSQKAKKSVTWGNLWETCNVCGIHHEGDEYPMQWKWCWHCNGHRRHHPTCCPKRGSSAQSKWKSEKYKD